MYVLTICTARATSDTVSFIRAGKDAARAFATGCFQTHQTYDIRELSEDEMRVSGTERGRFVLASALKTLFPISQGLNHWKKFYADSNKYHKVGRVSHPPIDPMSPIPEHCEPKKAARAQKKKEKEAAAAAAAAKAASQSNDDTHSEL